MQLKNKNKKKASVKGHIERDIAKSTEGCTPVQYRNSARTSFFFSLLPLLRTLSFPRCSFGDHFCWERKWCSLQQQSKDKAN